MPSMLLHSSGVSATTAMTKMENKRASMFFGTVRASLAASATKGCSVGTWMTLVRGFTRSR